MLLYLSTYAKQIHYIISVPYVYILNVSFFFSKIIYFKEYDIIKLKKDKYLHNCVLKLYDVGTVY